MMTKSHLFILLLTLWLILQFFPGCGSNSPDKNSRPDFHISPSSITGKNIQFIETKHLSQIALGCDFDRNEIYMEAGPVSRENHIIRIVNLDSMAVKKELTIPRGSFESPADFYNPTYMKFINGMYFLVDQYHKYVVYDQQFNRLYYSRFVFNKAFNHRHFIDFYGMGDRVFFVFGHAFYLKSGHKSLITLNEAVFNRRHETIEEIFSISYQVIPWEEQAKNLHTIFYSGSIWPSTCGFEKDGKVYYSAMTENRYYVYDLQEKKTLTVALDYLTPRTFSSEDAEQLQRFIDPDGIEEFWEQNKKKLLYIPYPGEIYHLGMYNTGKNKIGIIGDIRINEFKFRLDVIDSKSHCYLESLWIPFHSGFVHEISEHYSGVVTSYFNLEKGIYIWHVFEDDQGEYSVRVSRFTTQEKKQDNDGNAK